MTKHTATTAAVDSIGSCIRSIREAKGLPLREIAYRANIDASYLSRIETGELVNPTLDMIKRIAAALGVRPGLLIDGELVQHRGEESLVSFFRRSPLSGLPPTLFERDPDVGRDVEL